MKSKFSDLDTETFYDAEDSFYRSFWDREGGFHWGVFDDQTGPDFLNACANLNRIMATKAEINSESHVLDLGCGSGAVATWLCREFGSRVTGVDLSGVRIEHARELQQEQPSEIRQKLSFAKASATDLPFSDGSFTHVWSQAVIYHVHDKEKALQEVHRVIAPDGRFVFDDLIKPRPDISDEARAFVYDRLKFDTDFGFHTYQDVLADVGFNVLEAHDLSPHLKTSYERLADITENRINAVGINGTAVKYRDVTAAYRKMALAVEREELGWGLYVCTK